MPISVSLFNEDLLFLSSDHVTRDKGQCTKSDIVPTNQRWPESLLLCESDTNSVLLNCLNCEDVFEKMFYRVYVHAIRQS